MKKKLAVLTLALSAAMMLSFGAFAEEDNTHSGNDDTLVVHDHEACMGQEPVDKIYVDPTCTDNGKIVYRYACLMMPDEYHEQVEVLPALGHAWASEQGYAEWGRITIQPTCTQKGQAIDYCLNCGEERDVYRDIDLLEHQFDFDNPVIDVETNCDHAGKYHIECKWCGTPYTENGQVKYYEIPRNYNYHNEHPELWDGWYVEKEPTCVLDGSKIRACTLCGAKEAKTIPALGHHYVVSNKEVKNCYVAELTWTCDRDGCTKDTPGHEKEGNPEETPVNSHVFKYTDEYVDWEKSKEPTCTENGYKIYKCVYFDVAEVVGLNGETHDSDPTATVKVPWLAPGHDWSEWTQRYAPNAQDNKMGYWVRSCKRCGETQERVSEKAPEDYGKNGWVKEDGKISYYKQDVLQSDMTGVYAYNDGLFFVTGGSIDSGANGLNLYNGVWYFLANGQVQSQYTGVAMYDGATFQIVEGILNENANGLYDYDGGKFLFAAGKLRTDVSGLWQNPANGEWYYLADGQVVSHTGVVQYDGAFFYVANGKLASSMYGTIEYDGETFKVVAGQLY